MYDTDYEPPTIEQKVVFKPFYPSPAGYRLVEYRGSLSDAQLQEKNNLEKNV